MSNDAFDTACRSIAEQARYDRTKTTEDQVTRCIRHAIECGDFLLYVVKKDDGTSYTKADYKPYREAKELSRRLVVVTKALQQLVAAHPRVCRHEDGVCFCSEFAEAAYVLTNNPLTPGDVYSAPDEDE